MNRMTFLAGVFVFAATLLALGGSAAAVSSECCGNNSCGSHGNGETCRTCPEDCGPCRTECAALCASNAAIGLCSNFGTEYCVDYVTRCMRTFCDDPLASIVTDRPVGPAPECPRDRPCGDGVLADPEECDDGAANGTDSSCCSANCEILSDGAACDDRDPCTLGDSCRASVCEPGDPTLDDPLADPGQTIECAMDAGR